MANPPYHLASHDLPITGGFTPVPKPSGALTISVYCDRCKGRFLATRQWAERYLEGVQRAQTAELNRVQRGQKEALDGYVRVFTQAGLMPGADANKAGD